MTLRRFLVPAVLAAALLAGCGSDGHSMGATGSADPADIEFAQGMIAHHEQAIEMAELALDPATGAAPAVTELAGRIKAAQDPEIDQMSAWLTEWGAPMEMDTSEGHDMSSMPGMLSSADLDAMDQATRAAFDELWLRGMIAHHEGAVTMAEDVRSEGADAGVRTLAEQIIATQQAEIAEMEALLAG